jgi:uncharacterized protein (UPF0147 family)
VFTKTFRGWVQDGCSQKRVTLLRRALDRSGRMEMDLKALKDTPPWDWPAGMAEKLANVLRDQQAIESDRLLATDMAGDFTVVNDELVEALLAMLRDSEESKQVRARAAISLGPILEYADTEGFDDPGDVPISKRTFQGIQESLRQVYMDAHIPKEVRRRILEASVRAPGSGTRMPSVALTQVAMTCGNLPRSSACASSAGSMSRLLKSSSTKIQTFTSRLLSPQEAGASKPRGRTSLPLSTRAERPSPCFWRRSEQFPAFVHRKPARS